MFLLLVGVLAALVGIAIAEFQFRLELRELAKTAEGRRVLRKWQAGALFDGPFDR